MTFKKELSLDGLITLLSIIGAVAVIYGRIAVLENEVAEHGKRLDKFEQVLLQQEENTTQLRVMLAGVGREHANAK